VREHPPGSSDKDYMLATMFRLDPQKLAALRRATTGITRCPECNERNDASRRFCSKCGAKLYPVEEHDDKSIWDRGKEEEQ